MMARGCRMLSDADDIVILCRSREEADAALAEVRVWVEANGLTWHPDKTPVGGCRQAAVQESSEKPRRPERQSGGK